MEFYDIWVARDTDGNLFLKQGAVRDGPLLHLAHRARACPSPSSCCWNGMVVLNTAPFLRHGVRIRCLQRLACHALHPWLMTMQAVGGADSAHTATGATRQGEVRGERVQPALQRLPAPGLHQHSGGPQRAAGIHAARRARRAQAAVPEGHPRHRLGRFARCLAVCCAHTCVQTMP